MKFAYLMFVIALGVYLHVTGGMCKAYESATEEQRKEESPLLAFTALTAVFVYAAVTLFHNFIASGIYNF